MLVSKQIIDNIDALIDRAYLDFTYYLTGDELLTRDEKLQVEALGLIIGRKPLIELLYLLVRQRALGNYTADQTLASVLDSIALNGYLPVINDAHFASLANAKRDAFDAIMANKAELKKKVKRQIQLVNEEIRQDELINKVPAPEQRKKRDHASILALTGFVGVAIRAAQNALMRDLTGTITNTVSNGVLDEASLHHTDIAEASVYKTVINDGKLCEYCHKFYIKPNGEPRLFKVRELLANGTNEGKPKSRWRPVFGPTHPRCRCELHLVR